MGDLESKLRRMSSSDIARTGCILLEFFKHWRTLDGLPFGVVRHLLRADDIGPIPNQGLGHWG
jgi:hypothetical protein